MDSRHETAGKEEREVQRGGGVKEVGERAFDKICKGRKLNPRQKYQNLGPSLLLYRIFLVTDEESRGNFEFLMSPL